MAKASDDGGVGGRDEGEGDILTWQWRCGWGGVGGEGRGGERWEGKGEGEMCIYYSPGVFIGAAAWMLVITSGRDINYRNS